MKIIRENFKPLTLLLVIPIMNLTYVLINKLSPTGYNITLPIDNKLPFLPIFIIPYIIWYLFIPLSFFIFCLKDKKTYFKTMLIYVSGCIIASIVFLTFQTTVPRTQVEGSGVLINIIKMIYANDNPVNCLPSLHVFTSYLIIRVITKSKLASLKVNLTTYIIASLIILSTLFTKQHAVLDVLSGMVLAEALIYLVNRYEAKLRSLVNKKLFSFFYAEGAAEMQ
jgi:membrane-associated phospholipid phosphatase